MRALRLLPLLFAVSCATATEPTCPEGGPGRMLACVWMAPDSQIGEGFAHVFVREDDSSAWIEALTDDEGCVSLPLPAGEWQVYAEDANRNCVSEQRSHEVFSCDETGIDLYVLDGCLGVR